MQGPQEAERVGVVETLRRRADFVRLRRGRRSHASAFLLQSAPNGLGRPRFGFTVTKKIGNAVCRNRIKRRFRAAVSEVAPGLALAGHDYVLIARPGAEGRAWPDLLDDLRRALKHARGEAGSGAD